jgi:hypothetical protein
MIVIDFAIAHLINSKFFTGQMQPLSHQASQVDKFFLEIFAKILLID